MGFEVSCFRAPKLVQPGGRCIDLATLALAGLLRRVSRA